jgi:rhodanese-related sulfurtransferase
LKGVDSRTGAIIDTRPWAAFKAGHVPGALHVPLNNSFNTDAGSMIGEDETIYLIVDPARVDEAVRDLIRIGLDNVGGWFDAREMEKYRAAGGRLVTTDEVSAGKAQGMLAGGKAYVLDARRGAEFVGGHIPGAKNIAHTRLLSRALSGAPGGHHHAQSPRLCRAIGDHPAWPLHDQPARSGSARRRDGHSLLRRVPLGPALCPQ